MTYPLLAHTICRKQHITNKEILRLRSHEKIRETKRGYY